MNILEDLQPKLTGLIWLQVPAGWVWVDDGQPKAFFNNPHDYVNNIRISDPGYNVNLWKEIEKSFHKYLQIEKVG